MNSASGVAPRPLRRKRRKSFPWARLWGTALVVNVAAGLLWSPALRLRRVTIEGPQTGEAPAAEQALKAVANRPVTKIDPTSIESAALADTRFAAADLRRSLFGSARLTLTDRHPIARVIIVGMKESAALRLGLDPSGVIFRLPKSSTQKLPNLLLRRELALTVATVAAPVDLPRLAELFTLVRPAGSGALESISVLDQGALCLNMSRGRVRLGDGQNLRAKLDAMERILRERPDLFTKNAELNLVSPEAPKVVPRTPKAAQTLDISSPAQRNA